MLYNNESGVYILEQCIVNSKFDLRPVMKNSFCVKCEYVENEYLLVYYQDNLGIRIKLIDFQVTIEQAWLFEAYVYFDTYRQLVRFPHSFNGIFPEFW